MATTPSNGVGPNKTQRPCARIASSSAYHDIPGLVTRASRDICADNINFHVGGPFSLPSLRHPVRASVDCVQCSEGEPEFGAGRAIRFAGCAALCAPAPVYSTTSNGHALRRCSPTTSTSRSRPPVASIRRWQPPAATRDPKACRTTMQAVIDAVPIGAATALVDSRTYDRIMVRRATAYSSRRGTSDGPTEAINGSLEHLRGCALGLRSLKAGNVRSSKETLDREH